MKRVVVIDDHAIFRAGLRLLLQSQPHINVVGEADARGAAVGLVAREQPDIILLDIDMHGKSSLDPLPDLLGAGRGARAIVLTDLPDPEVHRHAVSLGAAGVVMKDEAEKVLVKAISKVGEGEVWLDRRTVAAVFFDLSRRRREEPRDEEALKIDTLTTRERQIIRLVAEGLENREIAGRLRPAIGEATVRHHLTSIFAKLDVKDRWRLTVYAHRHGLAHPPA